MRKAGESSPPDFFLKQTFPRKCRLTKKLEFDRLYRQGKLVVQPRVSGRVMVGERPRLGITVGRKYGVSSVRNRFKRQVRAVFRQRREQLPGVDILVAVRPGKGPAGYQEIQLLFDAIIARHR